MIKVNSVIAKVEEHPKGLVLVLDEKPKDGARPRYFLNHPSFRPKIGDVLQIEGRDAFILTGKSEHSLKRNGLNTLVEIEGVPGHA